MPREDDQFARQDVPVAKRLTVKNFSEELSFGKRSFRETARVSTSWPRTEMCSRCAP